VRGAVDMRSGILKPLVRLRDMEPNPSVAFVVDHITSNHLRGE